MVAKEHTHCPIVLVVEDDDFLRIASSYELAASGFRTLLARSADEAVTILKEYEAIDAVFTDISMPGSMNGIALAHHVSKIQPQTCLVVTSGDVPPEGQHLPVNSHFVPKPYVMCDIAAMIREHLEEQPA